MPAPTAKSNVSNSPTVPAIGIVGKGSSLFTEEQKQEMHKAFSKRTRKEENVFRLPEEIETHIFSHIKPIELMICSLMVFLPIFTNNQQIQNLANGDNRLIYVVAIAVEKAMRSIVAQTQSNHVVRPADAVGTAINAYQGGNEASTLTIGDITLPMNWLREVPALATVKQLVESVAALRKANSMQKQIEIDDMMKELSMNLPGDDLTIKIKQD